jgi:hypothetical protein
MDVTDEELVLRPSRDAPRARRLLRVATPVAALTILAAGVLAFALPSPATIIFLLVVLVDYVALPQLYLRNATVFVRGDVVGKTDLLGRTSAVPIATVRAMEHARPYVRTTVVRLLDGQGAVCLKFYPTAFGDDQLDALRSRLGLARDGAEAG